MTFFVCAVCLKVSQSLIQTFIRASISRSCQVQLEETIEVMNSVIVQARNNDTHHFSVSNQHFQWVEPRRTALKSNKQVFLEFIPRSSHSRTGTDVKKKERM